MDLRIFTEPQQGASYDQLLRVAKATEDAGYDAFFRSDHYLKMGAVSGSPGPTDAWITHAGLARDTNRIRLGTLVTSATFRHPAVLAISVAQVDQMSGGRVEFALGSGWYDDEHRAYGIELPDVTTRFDRYTEQLEIITGLWDTSDGEPFSYDGEHYRLDQAPAWPKPAQQPRVPIIIGGLGKKRTPELAARFADEFNVPFADGTTAARQFERVTEAMRKYGRDSSSFIRSMALTVAIGRDDAEVKNRADSIGRNIDELRSEGIAGTPDEVVDRIGRLREETGVSRLYLQLLDLTDIDQVNFIAAEVAPQLG